MIRTLSFASLLLLASCAQPFEGRVAARLTEAGLPRGVADCMAKRWVDRLSLAQLQKISTVAEQVGRDGERGRLTVLGFAMRVREMNDPEISEVVTVSAAACALAE